jgi:hypothetical protein
MANFLFEVEQKNRLEQKGILKRFSIECYGKQKNMEDIRSEKAEKYRELSHDKSSIEYQSWFLKYNPSDNKTRKTQNNLRKTVKRPRNRRIRKSSRSDYLF